MNRRISIATTLVAVFVLLAAPASAAELSGQTPGGAFYRIAVPDGWSPADGLVIWNHGYDTAAIGPDVDLGPLAELQLAEGFAVAASSYRVPQWALFGTVGDLRQLVDVFESRVGVPEEIYLSGRSMGGLVTAQAIELGNLGNVVGALPFCGIMSSGLRWWDQLLDHRLIYDFVCRDVPGGAIPGGAGGLPFPPDPDFNPTPENPFLVLLRIDTCLGIFAPQARTPLQQARMDRMVELTGVSEFFAWTNMFFATFGIQDLVHQKFGGVSPLTNSRVVYADPQLDAAIERVAGDAEARCRLFENFTPGAGDADSDGDSDSDCDSSDEDSDTDNGNEVGDVKIVSLHTDKDGLVLVEVEGEYAEVVPEENLTTGVVVEEVPSHCGFTSGELVGGWEALRAWVAGGPQPSAADLQASCQAAVAAGLADGPCRIDPDFVIGDLEDRVPPR